MVVFSTLREKYLNSGSRHFTQTTDLKRNRMLNMLFSMGIVASFYIAVIEVVFAAILITRDYDRYISYLFPFVSVIVIYPILVAITFFIKNITGSIHVTLLNNFLLNGFCLTFALFLGEKAQMHFIILSHIPIIFLIYRFGSWKSITAHLLLAAVGLIAILGVYRFTQPLYPLPDDLAYIPGYLCWIATFGVLVWYSIYNWKLVFVTESLLEEERDQTQKLLNETIPKLEKAETKYRHLVDGSNDLIFLLSTDLTILNMNKSSQSMLAFLPTDMECKNLTVFIAERAGHNTMMSHNIVREQAAQALMSNKPVRFRTRFIHKHREDGVEVLLSFQASRFNQEVEIMARAVEVEPEIMLRFLERENGNYTLDNNILHADILSERIADRISSYYNAFTLNLLRTCIREILINAIEHGNLDITFEEKSRVIESQNFIEFLRLRQKEPQYMNRKVRVRYAITREKFIIRITDEGKGFDYVSFLKRTVEDDSMLMLEHGRGITMTQNTFDEVRFNDKGNQVTLIKYHRVL
ncbi:MAG TPA: ATP-binding protein [Turneriella sp.]|nr:ATP-binding protein [Turneriella sp.]